MRSCRIQRGVEHLSMQSFSWVNGMKTLSDKMKSMFFYATLEINVNAVQIILSVCRDVTGSVYFSPLFGVMVSLLD